MTLYMKSVGITLWQTSIINTTLAWTSVISGPIIGALADKAGRYRLILSSCLLFALLLHIALLFGVPVFETKILTLFPIHQQFGNMNPDSTTGLVSALSPTSTNVTIISNPKLVRCKPLPTLENALRVTHALDCLENCSQVVSDLSAVFHP